MEITCNTCHQGTLTRQRVYKMSQVVVTIGYILLIPSVMGILASGGCAVASLVGGGAAASTKLPDSSYDALRKESVPETIITQIKDSVPISPGEMAKLTPAQRSSVEGTVLGQNAGKGVAVASGVIGVGASMCSGIMALVGGLLGWLLIMKRTVLKCGQCGAVTDAA